MPGLCGRARVEYRHRRLNEHLLRQYLNIGRFVLAFDDTRPRSRSFRKPWMSRSVSILASTCRLDRSP
jgi:hypothetical protein